MKIEANSITLDVLELRALLTTASDDPCRVNLHAVRVEPAGGVAVTTDGFRMTIASAEGERFPEARAVTLPLPMLESAAKAAKKHDSITIAWTDDDNVTATVGLVSIASKLSTNGFPPWRMVFPSELHRSRVPLTLNPYYLADALTVLAKLQGRSAQITCWGPAEGKARKGTSADSDAMLSPIVFTATDRERGVCWRIVIMPVRGDHDDATATAWQLPALAPPPPKPDTLERDDVAAEGGAVVVPIKKKGGKKNAAA